MSGVKNVIDSFDSSDEIAQVQKEAVEALASLGRSKAEVFKMEIEESLKSAGNGSNLTVPVSSILRSLIDVRAYSSSESGHIGNVVKNALGAFIGGTQESVIDGVGSLISDVLNIFLGKASASSGSIEEYYVATEGLSIIRIDIKAWYLNVSSQSIKTKMERIVSVVAIKSVVDLTRIDFSTFLYLYQEQLAGSGMDGQQLAEALAQAKKIYKDYSDMNLHAVPIVKALITQPPAASHLNK